MLMVLITTLDLFRSEFDCNRPVSHRFAARLGFDLLASVRFQESRFEALL